MMNGKCQRRGGREGGGEGGGGNEVTPVTDSPPRGEARGKSGKND